MAMSAISSTATLETRKSGDVLLVMRSGGSYTAAAQLHPPQNGRSQWLGECGLWDTHVF
jgi:hypothetical protein